MKINLSDLSRIEKRFEQQSLVSLVTVEHNETLDHLIAMYSGLVIRLFQNCKTKFVALNLQLFPVFPVLREEFISRSENEKSCRNVEKTNW